MFKNLIKTLHKKPVSVKKGLRITEKVKPFDIDKFEPVHESPTHLQYNCPYCLEKRGKADTDGKFYWSKEKSVGYCFKCLTVGIIDDGRDYEEIKFDFDIQQLFKKLDPENISYDDIKFSAINYEEMFDPLDEEGASYLDGRIPFYSMFADKLEFRVNKTIGVAVPIYYQNKVISYNLRFYNPKGKMKYYIPEGMKVLYSPSRVFCNNKRGMKITLVEGYFDALGALLDGKPNPIAIFGKSITPLQIHMLRTISPSEIYVYLDESKLSWNLISSMRGKLPTVQKFRVIPTLNYDPEERLSVRIKKTNPEDLPALLGKIQDIYNSL